MSAARWYIERAGTEFGPVTWAELRSLAQSGRLRPTDLVRRDGLPYWQPAHEAREEVGEVRATAAGPRPEPQAPSEPAPPPSAADGLHPSASQAETVNTVAAVVADPEQIETSEPAAPTPPAAPARSPRGQTGSALLALVLGVGGLFAFGLLLGGLSVVVAFRTLREMRHVRCAGGRMMALTALLIGAAEVAVLATLFLRQAHARLGHFSRH
jgi:hypothetical protein